MASIRVGKSALTIEVNDNGDTIELYDSDSFIKAVVMMAENTSQAEKNYLAIVGDESKTAEEKCAAVDQIFAEMDAAIDALFGEGAYAKIFPETHSFSQYADFFSQIFPYLEQLQGGISEKYAQRGQNRAQRRAQK